MLHTSLWPGQGCLSAGMTVGWGEVRASEVLVAGWVSAASSRVTSVWAGMWEKAPMGHTLTHTWAHSTWEKEARMCPFPLCDRPLHISRVLPSLLCWLALPKPWAINWSGNMQMKGRHRNSTVGTGFHRCLFPFLLYLPTLISSPYTLSSSPSTLASFPPPSPPHCIASLFIPSPFYSPYSSIPSPSPPFLLVLSLLPFCFYPPYRKKL